VKRVRVRCATKRDECKNSGLTTQSNQAARQQTRTTQTGRREAAQARSRGARRSRRAAQRAGRRRPRQQARRAEAAHSRRVHTQPLIGVSRGASRQHTHSSSSSCASSASHTGWHPPEKGGTAQNAPSHGSAAAAAEPLVDGSAWRMRSDASDAVVAAAAARDSGARAAVEPAAVRRSASAITAASTSCSGSCSSSSCSCPAVEAAFRAARRARLPFFLLAFADARWTTAFSASSSASSSAEARAAAAMRFAKTAAAMPSGESVRRHRAAPTADSGFHEVRMMSSSSSLSSAPSLGSARLASCAVASAAISAPSASACSSARRASVSFCTKKTSRTPASVRTLPRMQSAAASAGSAPASRSAARARGAPWPCTAQHTPRQCGSSNPAMPVRRSIISSVEDGRRTLRKTQSCRSAHAAWSRISASALRSMSCTPPAPSSRHTDS
jgi:hypothetical protein